MAKVKPESVFKDKWLHFADAYVTLADAATLLGVSRQKLEKLIEADLLVWDQPPKSRIRYIERASLSRLKHPDTETDFAPLTVKNAKELQSTIDHARHKIAAAANLPPGAIKIFFDLGGK